MRRFIRFVINVITALLILTGIAVLISIALSYRKDGAIDTPMIGEPVLVESVSYERYAYQHLHSDEERQTYDEVYDCIINFKDKITVVTKDKDVLTGAVEAVMADYGNLFWVNGYQYNTYTSNDEISYLEYKPRYTMTAEQRDIYQAKVDKVVDEWLSGIGMASCDFDKALYVYETLISKVDYDMESKENQNILSVFLYQSTVCQGYADAAWYMLDRLGIKSTIISGTANNQNHAWNLIYLDDAYYYMDVTWGNSKYLDGNNDTTKRINYAYFAMTTEELSQTHVISTSFEVPECLSNVDNYYVHKGLYYDWFGVDSIGAKFGESYAAGEDEISLKFSSTDLYAKVIQYFIDEKHISDYCEGLTSVQYMLDENANILTVKWM